MEFLREVLAGVRRLDEPEDETDELGLDDLELDLNDPDGETNPDDVDGLGLDEVDPDADPEGDQFPPDPSMSDADYDGADLSIGGAGGGSDPSTGEEQSPEMDDVARQATENPDRRGLIRTVKNAHLVYKRETEEGTFEELWVYNITNLRDEQSIKRSILSGTDIPINKLTSPDGGQSYEIWAAGNVEMLIVRGLPN